MRYIGQLKGVQWLAGGMADTHSALVGGRLQKVLNLKRQQKERKAVLRRRRERVTLSFPQSEHVLIFRVLVP